MKDKEYRFTEGSGAFWNHELRKIQKTIDIEFVSIEKARRIKNESTLWQKLVPGTGAEHFSVEEIQMALEAIFVLKFKKETPEDFERISLCELRRELQDEFVKTSFWN